MGVHSGLPEIVTRLRERAESYRQSGPSSEHTAELLDEAADYIETDVHRLHQALEEIDALPVLEINLNNYSHDDVAELNDSAVTAALIVQRALGYESARDEGEAGVNQ